jgi:hyperosmotically inducible periplasmic protein
MVLLLIAALLSPHAWPDQQTDRDIQQSVSRRLADHILPTEGVVIVSVKDRVVTLRGTVGSIWSRSEAAREALRVPGVTSIVNALTIDRRSDEAIDDRIDEWLYRYVFYSIFDAVTWSVQNGVVSLAGIVTDSYKADAIADLVARVPGVQAVSNGIRLADTSDADIALQAAIANAIYRTPVFWAHALLAKRPIHILVDRQLVTLFGEVETTTERARIERIVYEAAGEVGIDDRIVVRRRE